MKWFMTSSKVSPANPNVHYLELPEPGTRFVVIRKDGSGAEVFYRTLDGDVVDADNVEHFPSWGTIWALSSWFEDSGYGYWAQLPDEVKLFYESLKAESQN